MKPRRPSAARTSLPLATALAAMLAANTTQAANYYWDGGNANWTTNTAWSTTAAGTTNPGTAPTNTAPGDDLFFNITAANDTSNIITLAGGNRVARSLTFNTAGTSAFRANASGTTTARILTLGSGGITLNSDAGAVTIGQTPGTYGAINITLGAAQSWTNNSSSSLTIVGTVNNGGNLLTVAGTGSTTLSNVISGSAGITKSGGGTLTLSGANSYTGSTSISGGTLILANANPLGTTPGTNGTSGISMAAGSTLQANVGATVDAPITLNAGGNITIANGTTTALTANYNGAISGSTTNLIFSSAATNNSAHVITLGEANSYTGNTSITAAGNEGVLRLRNGIANALPTTTVLSFGTNVGSGSGRALTYDLNGNNQTLAGLSNGGTVPSGRIISVTSATAATLTINNTSDYTYGGAVKFSFSGTEYTRAAQITGAIALTKSGEGTFTLGGTLSGGATAQGNTFTGDTTVLGGILVLGERISLQNSALDTEASVAGDANNGLRAGIGGTGVTTLTLGGLKGNKNFADVFTTTNGGYSGLTALTLNPGTGVTHSYSGDIGNGNGTLALTKLGAGTQILTGANSYTGTTTVNQGTLTIGTGGTLGTGNGALIVGNNNTGAGTDTILNLAVGVNTTVGSLSGAISTPNSGTNTATINNGGAGTTFTVNQTAAGTFAGGIAGDGGFTLGASSTGTLTLTGTNTYTGATSINAGTLALGGTTGGINSSSGITVNGSGAKLLQNSGTAISPVVTLTQGTLTGNGTVNSVNVGDATGGILSNNNGVAGAALTIGTLTFNGAATVNTFSDSTSAPIITTALSSNLAGIVTINPSAASWTVGTPYNLISYGSIGGAGFDQFALGTVTGSSPRQTKTLADSGTAITLTVGTDDKVVWSGASNGNWITNAAGSPTSGTPNWALMTAKTATDFWAGDNIEFNDTYDVGSGPVAVTQTAVDISAGNVSPNSTVFNNSSVNYSVGSSGGFGIATGSLTKNGTGTVTLTSANTYTGATVINGGTLQLGDGTSGNDGSIANTSGVTNDGTLVFNLFGSSTAGYAISGSGTVIKTGSGTQTLTGANNFAGGATVQAGTLGLTGSGAAGTGTITLSNGGTAASTVQFNSAVTYNNAITVATGSTNTNTLLGSASGVLTLNGAVTINTGTTLTVENNGSSSIDIGSGLISGGGSLVATGTSTGSFIFRGANTYSGGTTLGGSGVYVPASSTTGPAGSPTDGVFGTGILNIGSVSMRSTTVGDTTIGNTLSLDGDLTAVTNSSEKSLTFSGPATLTGSRIITSNVGSTVAGKSLTFSGAIGDGGNGYGITKAGNGRLMLLGTNTYTGATVINAGTLQLGDGTIGNDGSIANTSGVTNDGTLVFNLFGSSTANYAIGGTGTVTKSGAGTLELSGPNTYGGGTTISNGGGTLRITNKDAIGAGAVTIDTAGTSTGTLELALTGTNTLSNTFNAFSSATALTSGGSNQILNTSGNNTITSNLTITGTGTGSGLNVASEGGLLTLAGTITHTHTTARTLNLGGNGDGVISGNILNNAAVNLTLNKSGAGTWTLTGTNDFAGTVSVTGGTLQIGNGGTTGTFGTGPVNVDGSSTLLLNRTDGGSMSADLNFGVGSSGGNNTMRVVAGTWNINGGAGTGSAANLDVRNTTTWTVDAGATLNINVNGTGNNVGFSGTSPSLILDGSGTGVVNRLIASGGAAGAVIKNGAGTWTLTAAYDGTIGWTTGGLTVNDGVLAAGADNIIPWGSGKGNVTVNDPGILDLTGGSVNINGLAGDGSVRITGVDDRVLTLGNGNANATFSGSIENTGTGDLGLTKVGNGIQTLSGASTYTGATIVSAGTLLVNGSLGNTAVTVDPSAIIGGTGSIGGSLTIAANSFLQVGDFSDPLAVAGAVTFGSGFGIANLLGVNWDSLTLNTPYTVISTSQTFGSGDIANFGLANAVDVGTSGRQAYFANGSLAVIVIPEPRAALLGSIGLLMLLRRRR